MTIKQILITVVLITVIAFSAFFILKPKTTSQNYSLNNELTPSTPSPTPIILLTWIDPAGFSFQYPQGTVVDKHPEDDKNYANLTLTFPDNTTAQIIMSDKTASNTTTATFTDNDVVVTVTGNKDLIIKSWQFIYPTPTTGKTVAPASNDGDVLEEE